MSRDIPIIFSAPMVRALLDGRKTMTRRLALTSRVISQELKSRSYRSTTKISNSPWQKVKVGDRLWVRESGYLLREAYEHEPGVGDLYRDAGFIHTADSMIVAARAYDTPIPDWIGDCARVNRPSIHMPRWASRLTLVVTATKIEHLHDMSPEDAEAEGCTYLADGPGAGFWIIDGAPMDCCADGAVECFERLWSGLHGAASWGANPEVVALSFRVVKSNIDAMEAA